MATGLEARLDAASNAQFQARVAEAIAEAAVSIAAEGGAVPGHAARAAYAAVILNDPPSQIMYGGAPQGVSRHVAAFSLALVGLGWDDAWTDAQISTGVASVWTALAGA